MANSTMSSTLPAPKSHRRRPAGEVVLGVDTHRDAHVASVLSLTGAVLATDEFRATAAGYRDLLKWARKSGTVRRAARVDPRTQDYYERRIKEGKTRREIVRCLKRYAAREVFHLVKQLQPAPRS
ncbi:hypothetical protein RFN58_34175 [Streptomyces iakyrus]|uniref:hypothetical protein n=1 Tax=Streptomyces iakyrus TaxID=68219 RepID=UPI0005250945|nr:hypothetical protein [Streptomyces iakyrus]